ncbi:MAG: LysR family transcriptional regulator [Variovorax sp.]|jgi:DNA-binding transcriptional LysR family regulator|nr:MAG: LysR family transcriptional regulator [Variovorax sp.]
MNLKQLRQFVVLAETLNFRVAAERLAMAQPPLSVSIRLLEEEIGQRLFDRSTGGVRLTAVGASVLEHARRSLYHAEQLRHSAQLVADGQLGSLRISFVPSSTIRLLPRAIAHFRQRHPRVDLKLSEAGTNAIMEGLHDGLIDVGLVRYPTPNLPSVAVSIVEVNRYVAALPAGHPKAGKARLRLADLHDEPFVMPSPLDGTASYMSMMHACAHAGFVPNIVQEASHAMTIVALVESGLGVALVPDIWQHLSPRNVEFRPLLGLPGTEIGLAFACRRSEEDAVLLEAFRRSVGAAVGMT